MTLPTSRRQLGITLIEILLVATIVAAGIMGVYAFAKKAQVSAAVESEQAQVDQLVKTIESSFAFQPNFGALGTNGAAYLRTHAAQSGIRFETDADGSPTLRTRLGGGTGTVALRAAQVDFASGMAGVPNNGFTLTYEGITSPECVSLITATASRTTRTDVSDPSSASVLVSDNGKLIADKAQIANACRTTPTVVLSFAPSRAIRSTTTVAPPSPRCAPVRESQVIGCPTGQVGSITQERDGTCSGPDSAMVYTAWNTVEDTCQDVATAPPDLVAAPPVEVCSTATFSRVLPCAPGQVGHHFQTREFDTCAGTYSAWETSTNSCHAPEPATCFPATEQQTTVACPSGLSGNQMRTRSSTCPSPTGTPVWTDWTTYANTCQGMPTCAPLRDTRTIRCAAGFWGDYFAHQEQFRACNTANNVGGWSGWANYEDAAAGQFTTGSCTACPPDVTETDRRWVNRSATCPSGQAGANTWQAEQVSTRTRYYACPASTLVLPPVSYTAWSTWSDTGSTSSHVNTCTACPGPQTETDSQTVGCPAGQLGSIAQQRTRSRSYACSGAGSWGAWSAWSAWSDVSNTCAAACVAPAPRSEWRLSTGSCPSGQSGTNTVEYRVQQTATCPSPTGTPVWGAWVDTGERRNAVYTCAANCVVPAPQSEWRLSTGSCPSGQSGTNTVEYRAQRNATCPSPTGSPVWGAWFDTGERRNAVYTCAANCVVPSPSTQTETDTRTATQNVACPAGQSGTHTQSRPEARTRTRTASCPVATGAPVWSGWSSWSTWTATGSWTTTSNTCAPIVCSGNSSETQWLPSSASCPSGQVGSNTWEREQRRTRTCNAGTWSAWSTWSDTGTTRNASNTCAPSCTAPAPSSTGITRALANENQNVGCPAGQTGEHWQTRTVVERGTRTTTWSCPGPTSSTSDAWGGGFNYGSWTTTSDTCAAPEPPRFRNCECTGNMYAGGAGGFVQSFGAFATLAQCEAHRAAGNAGHVCQSEITRFPQGPMHACYHLLHRGWQTGPKTQFCEHR